MEVKIDRKISTQCIMRSHLRYTKDTFAERHTCTLTHTHTHTDKVRPPKFKE